MSDDKKLRLVPPPTAFDERGAGSATRSDDDEPPPTEAELAEAEAIRLALEEGTEPISNSLRAANAPAPLSTPDHEAMLALALGDLAAPPTQLEQIEAARLASELGGEVRGEGSGPLQLARALRSAHLPRGLDQITHERILKKALGEAPKKIAATSSRSSRIVLVSGLLVAAAAFALFFVGNRAADAPSSAAKAEASAAPAAAATAAAAPPPAAAAPARHGEAVAAAEDAASAAPESDGAQHAKRGRSAGGEKMARSSGARFASPPADAQPANPYDQRGRAAAGAAARPAEPGRVAAAPMPTAAASAPGAPPVPQQPEPDNGFASAPTLAASFIPSRSTDGLFDPNHQFPKSGGESARIDRIAMARESELRQNRYLAWGVR